MVIHAQIEKAKAQEITDKVTGEKSWLVQITLSDKSKPSAFRLSTQLVMYIGPEKFRKYFPDGDAEDAQVTLLPQEVATSGTLLKVRGELVKGWMDSDQLRAYANTFAELPPAPTKQGEPLVNPAQVEAAAKQAEQRRTQAQQKAA